MKLLKAKKIVLAAVAALVLVATPASFVVAANPNPQASQKSTATALAATDCRRLSAANASGQDIFLSTATPKDYVGTAWKAVDCTSTTFRLKYNERAVVVADVAAETDCKSSVTTNGQWCETRALLAGVEGAPIAAEPSSFAMDSVQGGSYDWQAHSMNRAWEIRCGLTAGCQYKFVVETKNHDTNITSFWLDEVAVHLRINIGAPAPL